MLYHNCFFSLLHFWAPIFAPLMRMLEDETAIWGASVSISKYVSTKYLVLASELHQITRKTIFAYGVHVCVLGGGGG